MQAWIEQLNRFYRSEPAMHVLDNNPAGFEWVDANDNATSTISLLRKSETPQDTILVVCNFTPVPRVGYRVGAPHGGYWREMLNSDAREYAGSGIGNLGGVHAEEIPTHGRPFSLKLTLPPLGRPVLQSDLARCLRKVERRASSATPPCYPRLKRELPCGS